MTFTLAPYQFSAVTSAATAIRDAQERAARPPHLRKVTAVGLTAPTGAGKTVIATHLLENLLFGDDDHAPNPNLTVLWVTDDPALNRQTANKMLIASSSRITESHFVFMDSGFDKPRLVPGRIHFVHIQQLGVGATSFQQGRDGREHGFWNSIAATVEHAGANFLLVIDEAHKGTSNAKAGEKQKIAARLMHGTEPGQTNPVTGAPHPAAPVVLGISATSQRFVEAVSHAGRLLDPIDVPVAEVKESGLLKDRITVRHPDENQTSEATLIAIAVEALKKSTAAWEEHYEVETKRGNVVARIQPLLVIQVKAGIKEAEVGAILDALKAHDPTLTGDAIAHAFGEPKGTYDAGAGREVRYLPAEQIQHDPRCRVVLFKDALTTGWDCPRAEVMLSLRVANDYTTIAQLIGRMVRTPLAARVETPGIDADFLNKVVLFLPHYSKEEVAKVIAALRGNTPGDGPEIELQPFDFPARSTGNGVARLAECFEKLADLPSATRVRKQWGSETARYMALADLLNEHGIDTGGQAAARLRIVSAIHAEALVRKEQIDGLTSDVLAIDMTGASFDTYTGKEVVDEDEKDSSRDTEAGDVVALYKKAERLLPDASAKWYWNHLVDDYDEDEHDARARVAALCRSTDMANTFRALIEKTSREQIAAARTRFGAAIKRLGSEAQAQFAAVWSTSAGIAEAAIQVPTSVSTSTEKLKAGEPPTTEKVPTYAGHLFAAPDVPADQRAGVPVGEFPATLTGWEIDCLTSELAHPALVAWYRNPPRSKHGLAVPYETTAEGGVKDTGLLYPDFLFFHAPDGDDKPIVIDIVDPHQHNQSDTGPKWAGLAVWATTNAGPGKPVRNVLAVIKTGTGDKARLLSLDLTLEGIADRLATCHTKDDIETLFGEHGEAYA